MKYRLLLILTTIIILSAGLLWWGHGHPHRAPSKSTSQAQSSENSFDKTQYSLDDPTSPWVVVNKDRPLNPATYVPSDLTDIGNGQTMRNEAAKSLTDLFAAAKNEGYILLAESGYRSYQAQVVVYNHEVQAFGQAKADTESSKPGYSEHQTGWAVDIQTQGCMEDCFASKPAAAWLKDNAYQYGFILRYTPDKVKVTGYRSEPWHYRYVGKSLALELRKSGQTMEEFFGLPAVGAP